ncbi:AMP-binding protein [Sulfitobacter sp. HNIBRBA3233]|uniref:class I adenylate-forming enzyme family protein n=1 Tax=Sulfitobacter marinivivus TaxID=3158558 RepID=UPI0032DEF91D
MLSFGAMLDGHARVSPDRLGARDLERTLSFAQWNRRARKLANALLALGLEKGDRVAVLSHNRLEWAELYAATSKAGLIIVPINFRLAAAEASYIIKDAGAACVIAEDGLHRLIDSVRADLALAADRFVHFGDGATPEGWQDFEAFLGAGVEAAPEIDIDEDDPWTLMYTSGTTGKPKGVIHTHRSMALIALVTENELKIGREDDALLVMPMCHANSLNFFCAFGYCGGTVTIYSRPSFDAAHAMDVMEDCGATFTSLVPTHYIMMLEQARAESTKRDLGRMTKLMISSAPARAETKKSIMEMFPNSGLFELYGSSEAGWVTMLHPEEQFTNLGSVGRECIGSAPVKFLDDDGNEVPDGTPGELFSRTPYHFQRYWNLPEKTREAFRGDYCSVGDIGLRDERGFLHIIDRKKNMIISGGENVYPTEVEALLGQHEAIRDVAVIGLPDPRWGERVHAVVALRDGCTLTQAEVISFCADRIAGFKKPRSVSFVPSDAIPRTATGKIQHSELRSIVLKEISETA